MHRCNSEHGSSILTPLAPIFCLTTTTPTSSPTGPIQVHATFSFSFTTILFPSREGLFADGDDFSWQTIERGRNQYYQRQLSNQIQTKTSATLDLLSSALKTHLNVGQNVTMNTSSLFMSMETVTVKALSTRTVYQSGGARIQMPPTLRLEPSNQTSISLRVRFFYL